MSTGETAQPNIAEAETTNTIRTQYFKPENIPESWKTYSEIRIVWDSEDPYKRKLLGVYEGSGGEVRVDALTPEELVDKVEEEYEFTSRRWTDKELEENPELAEATKENTELKANLYLSQEAVAQKTRLNDDLTAALASREDQIRGLTNEIIAFGGELTDLKRRLSVVENMTNTNPVNVEEDTTNGGNLPPPAPTADDPIPVVPPPAVIVPPAANRHNINVDTAAATTDEEATNNNQQPSRWNRVRQRLGETVLGWQVRAQNGSYRILDRHGRERYVVENDEEMDSYIESERRAGTAVIVGGVAVIGAGVIGWWLGKHLGHDNVRNFNEIVSQNNALKGQNNQLLGEVSSMKGQLSVDSSAIGRMSQRIAELKRSLNANHQILLGLRKHEAREALYGSRFRFYGGTHSEYLRYYGDTVWDHARRYIERRSNQTPNNDLIRRVTSKILSLSGLRWNGGGPGVDAHQLPINQHLVVPNKIY
jgi:hypothetical protein